MLLEKIKDSWKKYAAIITAFSCLVACYYISQHYIKKTDNEFKKQREEISRHLEENDKKLYESGIRLETRAKTFYEQRTEEIKRKLEINSIRDENEIRKALGLPSELRTD